jgi:hypothetical protein
VLREEGKRSEERRSRIHQGSAKVYTSLNHGQKVINVVILLGDKCCESESEAEEKKHVDRTHNKSNYFNETKCGTESFTETNIQMGVTMLLP